MTGDEMVRWHTDSMDIDLSKLQEIEEDRESQHTAVHGVTIIGNNLAPVIQEMPIQFLGQEDLQEKR